MPLCSHFWSALRPGKPVPMWAEPRMLSIDSILLPFLGTSNKPDHAGCSSELCLELDLLGSRLGASSLPPPHSGHSLSSVVHKTGPGPL